MTLRGEFESECWNKTTDSVEYMFLSSNQNYIEWLENKIYERENSEVNNECICCYMTTGEHSNNCPKYHL